MGTIKSVVKIKDKTEVCLINQHNCSSDSTCFIVDSGASSHLTKDKTILNDIKTETVKIHLAKDGSHMQSFFQGRLETDSFDLSKVLYVPDLASNLMSVKEIVDKGGAVMLDKQGVKILKHTLLVPESAVLLQGFRTSGGLFYVNLKVNKNGNQERSMLSEVEQNNIIKWHRRLGHLGMTNLKRLPTMCKGIDIGVLKNFELMCSICAQAKMVRNPHNTVRQRASRPLQTIHSDVCGPIEPATHDGKHFFVIFVDDYTHFCELYLMERKSEVFDHLKAFVAQSENAHQQKVSKLRCDNGGEYTGNRLRSWCKDKGIVLDYSVPRTPQLDGTSERMIRTILEKTRSVLFDSNSDGKLWGEAALTAAYLSNRSPSSTVKALPAELWTKKTQNLSNLQLFGSVVHAKVTTYLKKLESRAVTGVMVGYAPHGYRIWNPETNKIFISCDVKFTNELYVSPSPSSSEIHVPLDTKYSKALSRHGQDNPPDNCIDNDGPPVDPVHHEPLDEDEPVEGESSQDPSQLPCMNNEPKIHDLRARNTLQPPKHLKDYELYLCTEGIGLQFNECASDPKWQQAIRDEIDSINKNKVWTYVDRDKAQNNNIISSRWVFRRKDDGTHRARLVARGFEQSKNSVDFKDTFSPVVDTGNLRLLFAQSLWRFLTVLMPLEKYVNLKRLFMV
ncbi:hypothetical protein ONE63_003366 [Megalurothrips usitatus]|uniref:Integrase catalytic domain-containing protein n=1 Tax=Megalurothrips usitatus TaxID=439358 RepID=A0AAV7X735_9NEOP|nr:hypothetical protein ONE63_003366 [Megalurothrips usitatus]